MDMCTPPLISSICLDTLRQGARGFKRTPSRAPQGEPETIGTYHDKNPSFLV